MFSFLGALYYFSFIEKQETVVSRSGGLGITKYISQIRLCLKYFYQTALLADVQLALVKFVTWLAK